MQPQFNPRLNRASVTPRPVEDPDITRAKQLIGLFKTKINQILGQAVLANNPKLSDWHDLAGSIMAAVNGAPYEPPRAYFYSEFNQTMEAVLQILNTSNPDIILPLFQRRSCISLASALASPLMAAPPPRPVPQNEIRSASSQDLIPLNVQAQLQGYKNAHPEYGAALLFFNPNNPNQIINSLEDPDVINENGQLTISPQTMAIISNIESQSGLKFSGLIAQWGLSTGRDGLEDFIIRPFNSEEVTRIQQINQQPQSYVLNGFSFSQEAMESIRRFYTSENFTNEKGGFLFGPSGRDEVTKFLEDSRPNSSNVEWVPPGNYTAIVTTAESRGMQFKGFIHSHPAWFGANPSGPDVASFSRIQESNPNSRFIYPILAQNANSRSYSTPSLALGNNWQIVGHVF